MTTSKAPDSKTGTAAKAGPQASPPAAEEKPPTTGTPADREEAAKDVREQAAAARARKAGECVVDDGTPHTGRAVNGKVCSAHAMHYKADGTRRAEVTRR